MDSVTRVGDADVVVCAVMISGEEVKAKPITLRGGGLGIVLLTDREVVGTYCAPGGSVCHDSGLPSNFEAGNISAICIGWLIADILGRSFS